MNNELCNIKSVLTCEFVFILGIEIDVQINRVGALIKNKSNFIIHYLK